VLRRRRREGERERDEHGNGAVVAAGADAGRYGRGPWDITDDFPQAERIDCGSLLIPVRDGFDVEINMAEELGAWVAVVHGESGMQLQAFAAPRSSGLWDEVRSEIAENVAESGGTCRERRGPLGPEIWAEVPIGDAGEAVGPASAPGEPGEAGEAGLAGEGAGPPRLHPIRFLGFDGPRWFLRGVISGPAASDPALSEPFDLIFTDVVVVRGDYPAPQRQLLEIRLPEDMQRAIEAELGGADGADDPGEEDAGREWGLQYPLTRGPEITETR
jgi:hypothetical protein